MSARELTGCNSLHHIVNFRPSEVMKAIKDTLLEITQDDTAGDALKRVIAESKTIVILIYQMIESGMIPAESELKQEYVDFVDYLMDFCTKIILESSSINSISDCAALVISILQRTELNACRCRVCDVILDNTLTQYSESMDIWVRRVIPSLVNTYLMNITSEYKLGYVIKIGMCLQNIASLTSSEVKSYVLKECIG